MWSSAKAERNIVKLELMEPQGLREEEEERESEREKEKLRVCV
jgi:hypothetical protein